MASHGAMKKPELRRERGYPAPQFLPEFGDPPCQWPHYLSQRLAIGSNHMKKQGEYWPEGPRTLSRAGPFIRLLVGGPSVTQNRTSWRTLEINMPESRIKGSSCSQNTLLSKLKHKLFGHFYFFEDFRIIRFILRSRRSFVFPLAFHSKSRHH